MDFYLEYYNSIENIFSNFTNAIKKKNCDAFVINNYSLEQCIISALSTYALTSDWKNIFNNDRIAGIPTYIIEEKFTKEILHNFSIDKQTLTAFKLNNFTKNSDLEDIFTPYQNQLIIYIFNQRQFIYFYPIIKAIDQKIILLSECEIFDNELSDYVTVIQVELFSNKIIINNYLEQNFPIVYHYSNTIEQYFNYLNPKTIIFLEGCHIQEKIINEIAKSYSIPTICIQQGWPSFMHSGFKNLSYNYYFTWSNYFNGLWEKYNPSQNYVSTGYIYEVEESNSKNRITFFLQSPVFISDNYYFNLLLNLIEETAKRYSSIIIQVKEHPEYKISHNIISKFSKYNNIVIVSDLPIKYIFKNTLVAISHFSSSLMEGIVHGCIPLVFDPTSNSKYYPNVESLGVGLVSKDEKEFFFKLNCILTPSLTLKFLSCIADKKQELFKATSTQAIDNTVNAIVSIVEGDIR